MKHSSHSLTPRLTKCFSMRKGFTVIEFLVAISIISILFVASLVRFGQIRVTARDGVRKTGARAIEQALESSKVVSGTYLVTLQGSRCDPRPATPQYTYVHQGAGCTGANGSGMGLVNLASSSLMLPITVPSIVHAPVQFSYAPVSIAGALKQNGYLIANAKDPQSFSTTDPNSPDFTLLSFNVGGSQLDGGDGAFISVFTSLEGIPSVTDATNTANFGGGANELPSVPWPYLIDFAAPSNQFTKNLLSIGSGSPKSNQALQNVDIHVALQK